MPREPGVPGGRALGVTPLWRYTPWVPWSLDTCGTCGEARELGDMADKSVEALVRQIRSWEGWRVEETRDGYNAYPPDRAQRPINFHRTPSDHRWYRNTISRLRRAGAPI